MSLAASSAMTKKSNRLLEREIAEYLRKVEARHSGPRRHHATRHAGAEKGVSIEGQEWTYKRERVRLPDRMGNYEQSIYVFRRVSDGRTMTATTSKEKGFEVIARRIREGVY